MPLQWAQGWEYGKLLNDVDINFDRDSDKITDITLTQYDATAAADLTEDEAIAQIVAEAQTKAEELGKEVIGTTEQAMFRGSDEGKDSGSNRGVESTLNNFIAQAQRASVAKATGKTIDLGVMNAGGVRADLDKGETTYEEVFTVQPFGNSVAYGKISGKDLIQAFENQWQPGNSRPRLSLGVSDNVSVVYDQTAEQGKRVRSVTIDGKQVEAEKDYTIALSTFLIGGGDGFFAEGAIKDVTDLGYMDTQAMIDYIKAGDAKARAGQSDVGVHIDGEVVPGKESTVNLSSLNYSTEGEPMAKTVTVELGGAKVTADIDNAAQAGDAQYGERGRASVKLTVPEGITGAQELKITTDAGTNVALPLDFGGDDKGDGSSDNGSSKKDSSADGSSIGGGIAVLVAVIAAVAGALAMAGNALPEPVRSIIAQLRAQLKF
nr:5'-nucleotidase C-terminal domain-containing protein [Corynebacterium phoceense]